MQQNGRLTLDMDGANATPTRQSKSTRHDQRPFLTHLQALTANSHPNAFSGTISRRSTFGTTAYNTNIMTLSPPYPIRRTAPMLQLPTMSPLTRRSVRKRCPLHAGGPSCFLPSARPSALPVPPPWCVATEVSSARVICCDVCLQAVLAELPVERRFQELPSLASASSCWKLVVQITGQCQKVTEETSCTASHPCYLLRSYLVYVCNVTP